MTDNQPADPPHEPDAPTAADDKIFSVSVRCGEDAAQLDHHDDNDDNDDHDAARTDAEKPKTESLAPPAVSDPRILAEKAQLEDDVAKLEQKLRGLQDEYQQTKSALSLSDDAADNLVDAHIQRLHEYNEIKDVGQMLLGKVAAMEGTTVKKMYERFGIELGD